MYIQKSYFKILKYKIIHHLFETFSPSTFLKCTLKQSPQIFNSGDSLEKSHTSMILRLQTTTYKTHKTRAMTIAQKWRNH